MTTPSLSRRDGGQAKAIDEALGVLADRGATIVEVGMPDLSGILDMWQTICGSEMAAAHAATYPSRAGEYGPYLRGFLAADAAVTPQQLAKAICLPSGFAEDDLPYSIQFAGRRLGESTLCRIAYAYERATAWHLRHPADV